jgi:Holliday junction resolvasome RuvABC endonuclease subunit
LAKSIDIQRQLKQQLDALDDLNGININIDTLLKSIKSETIKFINKNQKNIVRLLEVERQLSKLLNQHQSAIGTLEENIVNTFNVLSVLRLMKFFRKLISIH